MNRRTLLMTALAPFIPLPKAAVPAEFWDDAADDSWADFDYEMMPTDGLAWRAKQEDE